MTETISLREFLEEKISGVEEKTELKFTALQNALQLATTTLDSRLQGMNEFRSALSDQTKEFASKQEIKVIEKNIGEIKEVLAEIRGKASQQSVIISAIIATIGTFLGILNLIVK